jgi:DNA end-binding protein Ku
MTRLIAGGVIGMLIAVVVSRRERTAEIAGIAAARVKTVRTLRRPRRPRRLEDLTKEELYHRAREKDIPGRSNMSKDELIEALRQAR